jgi:hypothetical protein
MIRFPLVTILTLSVLSGSVVQGQQIQVSEGTAAQRNLVHAPWNPKDMDKRRKEVGLIGPGPQTAIPEARFPGYLKSPETVELMMQQAMAAVSQKGGRTPLGIVEPGEIVLIVVPYDAEPMVQEAITLAFEKRKIEARIIYENELVGVSKDDMVALKQAKQLFKAGDGQQESGGMFEMLGAWGDFNVYKQWLKEHDPVYYNATWPEINYPNAKLAELDKNYNGAVSEAVIKYLDEHEEIDRVFFRTGGRTLVRASLKHQGKKLVGNYTYMNQYDLMSQVPNVPADVWRMLEGKVIDPLGFIDRYEASDPEGTALWGDVTPEEAKHWAEGSYQQGHLYMLPSQSSGRYPYSRINYPATGTNWIEPTQLRTNGIVASTNSHATNHARIEVHFKEGYIQKIVGGGLYGDGMRLSLQYPKINDMIWPFQKRPGFWYLYEAGTATNPKYFKHPGEILEGGNMSERNAGGVIHWSFGVEVQNGPEPGYSTMISPKTLQFAKDNNLPVGHGMHHHNLLPTYQVRIRDTGNWITLIEHGQIQTYTDPEVRALASRYGDPDVLLRRDWIPELPGITVAGDYDRDYASDPGTYWIKWAHSIQDGTNKYLGK